MNGVNNGGIPIIVDGQVGNRDAIYRGGSTAPSCVCVNNGVPGRFIPNRDCVMSCGICRALGDGPRAANTGLCPVFPTVTVPLVTDVGTSVGFLALRFNAPTRRCVTYLGTRPRIIIVYMDGRRGHLNSRHTLIRRVVGTNLGGPIIFTRVCRRDGRRGDSFRLRTTTSVNTLVVSNLASNV